MKNSTTLIKIIFTLKVSTQKNQMDEKSFSRKSLFKEKLSEITVTKKRQETDTAKETFSIEQ